MSDHDELKRLAEAAKTVRRDANGRLDGDDAVRMWVAFHDALSPATVLDLLSEIAALRGEVQNGHEHLEFEVHRADQAERQRDELRKAADAMMPLLTLIEEGLWEDCPYPGVQAKRIASLRTLLANQGADQ